MVWLEHGLERGEREREKKRKKERKRKTKRKRVNEQVAQFNLAVGFESKRDKNLFTKLITNLFVILSCYFLFSKK